MGVRKSVLYFLNPRYWTGNGGENVKGDEYFLSCVCYYFFHALYGLILLTLLKKNKSSNPFFSPSFHRGWGL